MFRIQALLLLPIMVVGVAVPFSAFALDDERALVVQGDAAPGTGAGTFANFGRPSANAADEVVFTAGVTGGTASSGLFRASYGGGIPVVALALAGDVAPGTGGGTFLSINGADIADDGEIAFTASLSGGTAFSGLFRYDAGVITTVALEGNSAPDTGGGSFGGFFDSPSINASGEVAFGTSIFSGSVFGGIFVDDGVSIDDVSLTGEVPAGTLGQDYDGFGQPVIRPDGSTVFYAEVDASLVNGLFSGSAPPAGDSTLALAGNPAPVAGGTYSLFFFEPPGVNAFDDVAFNALLDGVPGFSGLFLRAGSGGHLLVVRNGDTVPDTGGGSFGFFSDNPQLPMGDPSEVLLFRAPLDGGSATSGIFGAQVGSPFVWVLEGDTAPDTGGGAYSSFDWRPTYGASVPHHVLFQASVTGGTATSGIFFVPEPVGGLWPGLALLGVMSLRRVPARREAR